MRKILLVLAVAAIALFAQSCKKSKNDGSADNTPKGKYFKNPVINGDHADPFVAQKDGYYYFLSTKGGNISIAKTRAMTLLSTAVEKVAWTPPDGTDHSVDLWAPELHFLSGKWYVYFAAATRGINDSNKMFVLENESPDPTEGTWTFKGRIFDAADDQWAIDGSVLTLAGKNYFIWSGWENAAVKYKQLIYIAPMADPWTLSGPRVAISSPTNEWEKHEPTFIGIGVNEGPIALQRDANSPLFVIFSASRFTSDDYCLAQIQLKNGGDPLNAADWINKKQVFVRSDKDGVYAPGHNGFFTSSGKDSNGTTQTEQWFVYHARSAANAPNDARTTRMQKLTWNADGSPNFGSAIATGTNIPFPIGE